MKKERKIRIGEAVEMACLVEASCEKPGNVTPTKSFDDLSHADFLLSAVALGRVFRESDFRSAGRLILDGVRACRSLAGSNANLGIILLLAPLAAAYYRHGAVNRRNVKAVLDSMTVHDAVAAYEAIRLAVPGGLGGAPEQDVRNKPSVPLPQAMKLAADRDSIAGEYSDGFSITLKTGVRLMEKEASSGIPFSDAVIHTYLAILAAHPDTHIARRTSPRTAQRISERTKRALDKGGVHTAGGRRAIRELDRHLRSRGNLYNPGTTADLVTAALFVYFLRKGYDRLNSGSQGR